MRAIFTSLMIVAGFIVASAQCTPDVGIVNPGLHVDADTCVEQGTAVSAVVQFKNYDQVTIGPIIANVDSIRFDSINNLPCGLQWTTNKADNKFVTNEVGCIAIQGTTNDPVGEYTADIIVTAWINNDPAPVQQPASVLGIFLKMRVYDGSTDCASATATQTASCTLTPWTGIAPISEQVLSLTNSPNPVSTFTNISFTAKEAANYSFQVFDVRGAKVYEQNVEVNTGMNTIRFDRNDLPGGVYVYSLTDGKTNVTRKMILAD